MEVRIDANASIKIWRCAIFAVIGLASGKLKRIVFHPKLQMAVRLFKKQ